MKDLENKSEKLVTFLWKFKNQETLVPVKNGRLIGYRSGPVPEDAFQTRSNLKNTFTEWIILLAATSYPNKCKAETNFVNDADPGVCPGSCFLPIPDPGSRIPDSKQQQKRGVKKKFVVIPFFVATNFTKLKIILFLKC